MSSFVIAAPEMLAVAATDLATIGSTVSQGAPISFVLANGQIHDWVLLTPDGVHYWPQIRQELGV